MYTVVIDTEEAFADLELQWRDLLERAAWSSMFSTPEWNYAWWRVFGEGRRLRVWTLWGENRCLVGLYPLYAEQKAGTVWLIPLGLPDYADMCGLVADRHRMEEAHREFFAWLAEDSGWSVARLGNVPLESMPVCGEPAGGQPEDGIGDVPVPWVEIIRGAGLRSVVMPAEPCMLVSLDGVRCVEDLFGSARRYTYRRKKRRLEHQFAHVDTRREAADAANLTAALTLSVARSVAYRDGKSFFNVRGAERFIREIVAAGPGSMAPQLFSLYLDGDLAAYEFAFLWRGSLQIYFRGYAHLYKKYSPGFYLVCQVINQCLAESGVHSVNLLLGGESYKYAFSPQEIRQITCVMYNNNFTGRCMYILQTVIIVAKKIVKDIVRRINNKDGDSM